MATHALPRTGRATFLTQVLRANAALTGGAGVLLALDAIFMPGVLGLSHTEMWGLSLLFLATGAMILALTRQSQASRGFGMLIAAIDALWAALSIGALVSGMLPLTPLGWWAVVVQADVAALFAALQCYALYRTR